MTGLTQICQFLQEVDSRNWICTMDANANQNVGFCPESLAGAGGVCRAVAAHQKSSYPIDAIWSSHETPVMHARSYVPGDGDHSIAEAAFSLRIEKAKEQQFRFSHVRKTSEVVPENPQVSWESICASQQKWQTVLRDVNLAWDQWCQDVEQFLTQNHFLVNNKPERKLGSVPTTKVSTHHVAPDQGLQERQLRRWIRRLDEAQTLAFPSHLT